MCISYTKPLCAGNLFLGNSSQTTQPPAPLLLTPPVPALCNRASPSRPFSAAAGPSLPPSSTALQYICNTALEAAQLEHTRQQLSRMHQDLVAQHGAMMAGIAEAARSNSGAVRVGVGFD